MFFRTRHLKCEKQSCDEFIVLHLGFLDYTHYIITVNFYGLEAFHSRYNINELYIYVSFAFMGLISNVMAMIFSLKPTIPALPK